MAPKIQGAWRAYKRHKATKAWRDVIASNATSKIGANVASILKAPVKSGPRSWQRKMLAKSS